MSRRLSGLLVFLSLLASFLGARAECAWPPKPKRALLTVDCPGFPKSGNWLMTHVPPTEGPVGVASTILAGQTVLNLKRSLVVRDAFSGDGFIQSGDAVSNDKATPDYHVALIFDKKACLFTGIVYRHEEPVFADAVEWSYDGMRIEGKCLFTNPLKKDAPVPRYVVHGYSSATLTYMKSNEATSEEESAAT